MKKNSFKKRKWCRLPPFAVPGRRSEHTLSSDMFDMVLLSSTTDRGIRPLAFFLPSFPSFFLPLFFFHQPVTSQRPSTFPFLSFFPSFVRVQHFMLTRHYPCCQSQYLEFSRERESCKLQNFQQFSLFFPSCVFSSFILHYDPHFHHSRHPLASLCMMCHPFPSVLATLCFIAVHYLSHYLSAFLISLHGVSSFLMIVHVLHEFFSTLFLSSHNGLPLFSSCS